MDKQKLYKKANEKALIKSSIVFGLVGIFVLLFSCKKELPPINNKKVVFPTRTLFNANIINRDSGRISMNVRSPLIEEFTTVDSPYTIFRKGVDLDFYQKGSLKPGYFQADWARLSDATGIYEGRGNVIIVNEKGDSLKSEQLFWNKKNKTVYTSKEVYLISSEGDSLTAKNGLQATDDLETYTLFNNQGFKYVDDNQKF
ncbi:LPS export ABC transporter periplasmic protein LptC [Empedobacter tilapiae]|uniref:LPS export ABC transporter periplasmic protein LptC n=1 Tax=Empedobacter tilapiae TaxID=2491114 RepID=A0A4Z1C3E8_9FLAO|nr:LPS export ABC transporter periplasmic protein LptC [Empedobacter tilapiae]